MSSPVILRRAARAEYDEAGDWYERQRRGLGAVFTAAIQTVFDRISNHPQLYRVVWKDVRRAVVPKFPYCVYW
jgi:plasmid stabilization system protein ParE